MLRRFLRTGAAAALLGAVALAGCSDQAAVSPDVQRSEAITRLAYQPLSGEYSQGFTCTFTSDAEGGTARCGEHAITIPAGAVSGLVDFHFQVIAGRNVEVELYATRQGSSTLNDVGSVGFDRPVTLDLSYAKSSDYLISGNQVTIVWIKPDGTVEPIPTTLNRKYKRAIGKLNHFSQYGLATM